MQFNASRVDIKFEKLQVNKMEAQTAASPALRPLGMGAQFHRVDGGAGLQGSHSYSRSATMRGNSAIRSRGGTVAERGRVESNLHVVKLLWSRHKRPFDGAEMN